MMVIVCSLRESIPLLLMIDSALADAGELVDFYFENHVKAPGDVMSLDVNAIN